MIKLTRVTLDGGTHTANDDGEVWIAPAHIIWLRRSEIWEGKAAFTTVFVTGNAAVDVKETPEEIMATDQMLYHMHPAMIVEGGKGLDIATLSGKSLQPTET